MKLRDLRELYQAPKNDLDDLEDEIEPENRESTLGRAFVGIDPAFGPDGTAIVFKCARCDTAVVVRDLPSRQIVIALCPKCDGCGGCGALYDEHGLPVPLRDGISIGIGEDGLVEKRVKMCEACIESHGERAFGFGRKKV